MGSKKMFAIEDITERIIDYRGKTPPKSDDGIRLVTAKVIKSGFIQEERAEYISEDTYTSWMRRGYPQQHDIVITTEAPLGEVAQLRTPEKVALAQRVILLRAKQDVMDQQYFYHALKSPIVQASLQQRSTGTTVLGIKQSELRKVEVPYFPLSAQRKIAAILSAYDDLIENNLRRIKILEEMAQNLYREWFVNFRFPGHENTRLVDSPLGEIPEGWEVGKITDLSRIYSGYPFKSKTYLKSATYKIITIKNVKSGQFINTSTSQLDSIPLNMPRYCQLKNGDILLSLTGNVGRTCLAFGNNLLLNQRVAKITPLSLCNRGYIYLTFRQELLREKLELMASGVAQQNLSPVQTGNMEILKPPSNILSAFSNAIEPICDIIISLNLKNENLSQTRDLLLPKIISGEVDVSDLDINQPEETLE